MISKYVVAGALSVTLGYAAPMLAAEGTEAPTKQAAEAPAKPAVDAPAKPATEAPAKQDAKHADAKDKHQYKLSNEKAFREHLEKHVTYPATKEDLVKACENMKDISKGDRAWFKKTLPEGTYNNADDVTKALGM
jgi:hypothetical protein